LESIWPSQTKEMHLIN